MESIIQNIYNGKEWVKVTAEPIYNQDNQFTGHFKEINREYVNHFGIFDDIDTYKTTLIDINNFRRKNSSTIYIAQGGGYLRIFSSYTLDPEYQDLGTAFLKFIENTGLIPKQYNNYGTFIVVDLYNRDTDTTIQLTLTKGTNYISTIR